MSGIQNAFKSLPDEEVNLDLITCKEGDRYLWSILYGETVLCASFTKKEEEIRMNAMEFLDTNQVSYGKLTLKSVRYREKKSRIES